MTQHSGPLNGVQILIVDDEEDLREIMRIELERAGATVVEAATGNDAKARLDSRRFDVVLTDVRMRDGDGLDLLNHVRGMPAPPPIVGLTTGFADLDVEDAYAAGAQFVLTKPFELRDLVRELTFLLTPPQLRWIAPVSHGRQTIRLAEGAVLGTAGFYWPDAPSTLMAGEMVGFELTFDAGPDVLMAGVGRVIWSNEGPEGSKNSAGILFVHLKPQCLEPFVTWTARQGVCQFIPTGSSRSSSGIA